MMEMTKIFLLAGIDVEKGRLNALNYIITMACEDFSQGDGVSAMPLDEFIAIFLDNRLGYSHEFVKDYILENENEYADTVDIIQQSDGFIGIQVKGI